MRALIGKDQGGDGNVIYGLLLVKKEITKSTAEEVVELVSRQFFLKMRRSVKKHSEINSTEKLGSKLAQLTYRGKDKNIEVCFAFRGYFGESRVTLRTIGAPEKFEEVVALNAGKTSSIRAPNTTSSTFKFDTTKDPWADDITDSPAKKQRKE